jgi:hypothetical protein
MKFLCSYKEVNLARALGLCFLLLTVSAIAFSPLAAHAAAWSSSDTWGTYTNGAYTVSSDVWGSGAGPETIWANGYSYEIMLWMNKTGAVGPS